ncbi:MAG: hypothetical protein RLZ45_2728 [Verrucomicrobiota bacterium]
MTLAAQRRGQALASAETQPFGVRIDDLVHSYGEGHDLTPYPCSAGHGFETPGTHTTVERLRGNDLRIENRDPPAKPRG